MAGWQTIPIPFGGGIDTRTEDKLVRAPSFTDLINVSYSTKGAIKKRNGYTALSTNIDGGGTISAGAGLLVRDGELLLCDDDQLYTHNDVDDTWIAKGKAIGYKTSESPQAQKVTNQTTPDMAILGGVRVCAWEEGQDSTVHYEVSDVDTGVIYIADTAVDQSAGTRPRVVPCGTNIVMFYQAPDNGTSTVYRKVFDTTDPTTDPAEASLWSDVVSGDLYDVCENYGQDAIVFAYVQLDVATYKIKAGTLTSAGAEDDTGELQSSGMDNIVHISVSAGATNAWCAYSDGTAYDLYADYWPMGTISSATQYSQATIGEGVCDTVQICCDLDDETKAHLFHGQSSNSFMYYRYISGSIGSAADKKWRGLRPQSQCFFYSGLAHIVVSHELPLQTDYYLMGVDSSANAYILARNVVGQGGGQNADQRPGHLPRMQQYNSSPSKWVWAASDRATLEVANEAAKDTADEVFADYGIRQVVYDPSAARRYSWVQAGRTTYFVGGILWQYDGFEAHEQGFFTYNEGANYYPGYSSQPQLKLSASNGSGSMESNRDYNYRFHWETTNKQRERFRGAGISNSVSLGSSDDTVTIDYLGGGGVAGSGFIGLLTNRSTPVAAVLSRSEADADIQGGAPLYRCLDANPSSGDGGTTNNTWMSDSDYTVEDWYTDATLIDNELDYQNSELDHIHPEAATIIAQGNGRVLLGGLAYNTSRVLLSKLQSPGYGLEFHDGLVVDLPQEGGAVTGLAVLDDKFVAFKGRAIFAWSGSVTNTGRGTFTTPTLITTDVGCINARSVVRIPEGVMFASAKGIYILTRGLTVEYIGAPVEAYNSTLTNITAATVVPDQGEVRFLHSSGSMLVYHYRTPDPATGQLGLWSRNTGLTGTAAVVASIGGTDTYVILQSDGTVLYEDSSAVQDDATDIIMTMELPWIYLAGPAAFHRYRAAHILGEWLADHDLNVDIKYDYTGSYSETDFDSSTVYSSQDTYQLRVNFPRQKAIAVKLKIYDSAVTSSTKALSISAIALEAAVRRGTPRVQSGLRIST